MDSPLTTEGNSAVRRDVFLTIGGFNSKLYGHEGIDLSYRLRNLGKQLYIPSIIIYHDLGDNLKHFLKKQYRHGYNAILLYKNSKQVIDYYNQFIFPSNANSNQKLGLMKKFQLKIIKVLSIGVEHMGSVMYRTHVILLKKNANNHLK